MRSSTVRRRALTAALVAALALAGTLVGVSTAEANVPTTYPTSVLSGSPIAYYRLDEAAGTTMVDSSGNGHDGTYSAGGVTLGGAAAIVNETATSAAFDGTGDGQASGVTAPTSAYTWEAWVNRADGSDGSIAGQEGAGQLLIRSDELVLHQTDTDVIGSGSGLTPGTWHHVAATWDGTDTTLYVDGTVVGTSNAAVTAPSGSGVVHVASGDQAADFNGALDEVTYYASALTVATIQRHYAIGADTTAPTVTITTPVDNGLYLLHAVPAPVYSCTDPGAPSSGIRSCVTSGGGTYLGRQSLTVTATDRAGNTASTTVFYSVLPIKYATEINTWSHPLAYYRMNDPVGATTMVDSSGNGNHGEYKNGAAPGGHKAAAIACERRPNPPRVCDLDADPQDWSTHVGGGGYGFVNNMPAPRTAYTLEAWIKPDNGDDGSIVGQGGAGQLYVKNGHLALRQTQDDVIGGGPVLTPGQWWHVAATWNGVTTRLYVNGSVVASSTTANKAPSGTATFYVGLGEMAPPFQGDVDEVAYYAHALSGQLVREHYDIGTVVDWPSIVPLPPNTNTAKPSARIATPVDEALYAPTKTPAASFSCTDPDPGDVVSCTATVDGNPIANGATLPDSLGSHTFVTTAKDTGDNTDVRTVTYTVMPFADIYRVDHPLAYYRLGDTGAVMADASGHGRDGTYKNLQESGLVGISGDGDLARRFWGDSGYGYADNLSAGPWQSTIEAWVNVDDGRDQSIAGLAGTDELFVSDGLFVYRHLDRFVAADVGPTPGVFRQVVGVWDGDTVKIYVDGVLHGTREAASGRSSGGGTFYVGFGTQAPWFAGSLDEVVYYVSALSADRVLQHFLADPPPATTAAVQSCRVPALRGLRLGAARATLLDAGCRLGPVDRQRSGVRKHGRVISQSVAAGQLVAAGRSIRVTIGR